MRNLKLTLEYDGTRYRGWQVQKNARTVGGVFAEAACAVLREPVRVAAAGRTDAGVHALAQVVSFRTGTALAPVDLRERLNDRLPTDINVLSVEAAPPSFHARHSALSRAYRYQVSTRRTAFGKRYTWWVRSRVDRELLGAAARLVRAARDFAAFAEGGEDDSAEGAGAASAAPGRVRILEAGWTEEEHLLVFRIRADRFLWKMVRRLVGAMVAEATGQIPRGTFETWIGGRGRGSAAWTAPPSGLFLEAVDYPPEAAARPARGPRGGGP